VARLSDIPPEGSRGGYGHHSSRQGRLRATLTAKTKHSAKRSEEATSRYPNHFAQPIAFSGKLKNLRNVHSNSEPPGTV
jgi:hypothetical protein